MNQNHLLTPKFTLRRLDPSSAEPCSNTSVLIDSALNSIGYIKTPFNQIIKSHFSCFRHLKKIIKRTIGSQFYYQRKITRLITNTIKVDYIFMLLRAFKLSLRQFVSNDQYAFSFFLNKDIR